MKKEIWNAFRPFLKELEDNAQYFFNKKNFWTFSKWNTTEKVKEIVRFQYIEPSKMNKSMPIYEKDFSNKIFERYDYGDDAINFDDAFLELFSVYAKYFSDIKTKILNGFFEVKYNKENVEYLELSQDIGYKGIKWHTLVDKNTFKAINGEYETREEAVKAAKEKYPGVYIEEENNG